MATLKADKAQDGAQPRTIHAGANSVKFMYSVTASLSAGDVIQAIKVPHGAIIDDIVVVLNSGSCTMVVGDGDDDNRYITSATLTLAAMARLNAGSGVGYQYNLSDDAADQFDTIDITIGTVASGTATGNVSGVITYHCDEADPA